MFLTLDSWVRPDEIFKSATVALVRRENDQSIDLEILAKKSLYEHGFGARIMLIDTCVTEISSSDIRDAIKSGSDTSEYLSKETAAYIKKEGLYGASYTESDLSDLRERVKGMLGEKRFSHTLGVERAASRLARVLIPEREAEARAAAILHDAAKELSRDEQRALLSDTDGLTQEDLSSEKLYHAFCAPALIKRDFPEFAREGILSAVFRHTSGESDMSVLDLIIFVADFIEDGREYSACRELREKLYRALDEGADPERALKCAALDELIFTESYLNSRGERLNSRSKRAIDYLKNELKR
jgi:predicted HD superfamily hydrolase involved in NAD metabolism